MKRIVTTALFLAVLGTFSAFAQFPGFRMRGPSDDDVKRTIEAGDVTMVVDATFGGRILSFQYKGAEILSQSKAPNSFGSTFWTSPQSEWNWPPVAEYDNKEYEVTDNGSSVILTGQKSERFGYRMTKEFIAGKNCVEVRYSIINESGEERKVAPWEISRVPGAGEIFFDADIDAITPAGLMPFEDFKGLAWFKYNVSDKQRKINADGKGWLAYANNGLLLIKKFADLTPSQPAPAEAEIQVYCNEGETFIELESQGAYTTLKPGEAATYSVTWYLLPVKEGASQKALAKMVKKAIK